MLNFLGVLGYLGVPTPVRPQPYWPHSALAAHRCTLPHTGVHQYTTSPPLCTSVSGTRGLVHLCRWCWWWCTCSGAPSAKPEMQLDQICTGCLTTDYIDPAAHCHVLVTSVFRRTELHQKITESALQQISLAALVHIYSFSTLLYQLGTRERWCHLLVGLVALIFVLLGV